MKSVFIAPPARGVKQDDGFSLLEVLTALLVLSLIGTLMSSFIVQLKHVDRLSQQISGRQESVTTLRYIGRMISESVYTPFEYSVGGIPRVFSGSDNAVRFVGPVRINSHHHGLRNISVRYDETKKTLQLAINTVLNGKEISEEVALKPLLVGKGDVRFSYLDEQKKWHSQWTNEGRLPVAVRIDLQTDSNPNRSLSISTKLLNADRGSQGR